jgi:oxygen-independent coproporphyrinogen-3 oxidase
MNPGVYVHIPFCEQRCHYCAFTIAVSHSDTYAPYVRRVVQEIEMSGFTETPETIFFGGGTPSMLEGELLGDILGTIPSGATEISIEVNPGTLSASRFAVYRALEINRISLGVQSFHDEDLKNAGRLHTAADVFRDIENLRKHGFTNLNLDLIAGLPGQQMDLWKENLQWIDRFRPEHVSIYMLDREDRSAWGKQPEGFDDEERFCRFLSRSS